MFFAWPAVAAAGRIRPEEAVQIRRRDGQGPRLPAAAQMLIKMGKVRQMRPHRPAAEALLQQPVTETIQERPQRTAP